MFLETDRLILRKFREEDFADFCAYAMDEEMCRMMGNDLMDTEETARVTFDWLKDKEERSYVLILKETGRAIGNLNVTPLPAELLDLPALAGKQGKSLSFCISRHYRRQGLMTEAVRAVIARLFEEEGMDYVQCGYFDFNTVSKALQKKLGFTHLITMTIDFKGEQMTSVENILWKRGTGPMFLETDRLVLRRFQEEDFADFRAWAGDPELCRMMGRGPMDTPEDFRTAFDWLKDKEERGYALVLKETGRVIGSLTVTPVHEHLRSLPALAGKEGRSLSFSLSPSFQRRGLMSEALRAVIAHLFEEGMDYVQCGYFDFNTASKALQEKLGFTHLTTLARTPGGREISVVENILWKE